MRHGHAGPRAINGRTITYNYIDAGVFNIGSAIQAACDAKSFFLVGEAWSFDGNQEETRLAHRRAMDNLYTRMAFVPFEEADVNKATQDYLDLTRAAGGDVSLLGAQATSSFLLWATAATACGDTLTRECTLTNLANTHSWTGHGLHAESDPGGNHPPSCNILLHLQGTQYVRVAPEKRGTFQCDPNWVAPVTKTPALAAAMLDTNRISRQFAAG